jgi:hypothetical protein
VEIFDLDLFESGVVAKRRKRKLAEHWTNKDGRHCSRGTDALKESQAYPKQFGPRVVRHLAQTKAFDLKEGFGGRAARHNLDPSSKILKAKLQCEGICFLDPGCVGCPRSEILPQVKRMVGLSGELHKGELSTCYMRT